MLIGRRPPTISARLSATAPSTRPHITPAVIIRTVIMSMVVGGGDGKDADLEES